MPMPLVSVITPTHKRPDMLAEALASVRAQTFEDYEIIVVSVGEGLEMGKRSLAVATEFGARWFMLPKGNPSVARNFAVRRAEGEWMAFLDDDDIWLPYKLERQLAAAGKERADMVSCDYVEFLPDGYENIRQPRLPEGWIYPKGTSHHIWWAQPSSVLLRKTVFDRIGGFDPYQRYAEDIDLWRRVSWQHALYQVEEVLMRCRCGHASMMRNRRAAYCYDLRHFIKMQFDTPKEFRSTLPSSVLFVWPILEKILIPKLLRQPFHPERLQRKWKMIKSWVAQS
jgi:glycosyltransferase involved in cell wall biosynthesis